MSLNQTGEVLKLRQIADELRATFATEGYTIERGLQANEAFEDGESVRSSMIRKLAYRAVGRGAHDAGLFCGAITGGGREIDTYAGNTFKHYRVLRITEYDEVGEPKLLASSPAILEFEPGSLWREERHLFGYEVGSLNTVETVLTAKILDIEGEAPGRLILGPITYLDPIIDGPSGFEPADEDLDGYDDGEAEHDTGS